MKLRKEKENESDYHYLEDIAQEVKEKTHEPLIGC